ncbi:unnamed protein product [Soboliphyme baturini]|uniref:EGF-like domain-containing protein n=1 Tax=Soboliphyme baturini TaxID=241478 RepID=A0A183J0I9_9BILA|nr:unnamed protein product [Soboliphyme baturini]
MCHCFPGKTGKDCSSVATAHDVSQIVLKEHLERDAHSNVFLVTTVENAPPRTEAALVWLDFQALNVKMPVLPEPGMFDTGCQPYVHRGAGCVNQCNCPYGSQCNVTNGNCRCPAGLHGKNCDSYCPKGRYGHDCALQCSCSMFAKGCHPVTGACLCPPGFIGLQCENGTIPSIAFTFSVIRFLLILLFVIFLICLVCCYTNVLRLVCPKGSYGEDCSKFCSCADGEVCHPAAGCCIEGRTCPSSKGSVYCRILQRLKRLLLVSEYLPVVSVSDDSTGSSSTVLVPVVVVMLLLVICLLVLLVGYYRKKYLTEKDPLPTIRFTTDDSLPAVADVNEFDNPLYDPFGVRTKTNFDSKLGSDGKRCSNGNCSYMPNSLDGCKGYPSEKMKLNSDNDDSSEQSATSGSYSFPEYEKAKSNLYSVIDDHKRAFFPDSNLVGDSLTNGSSSFPPKKEINFSRDKQNGSSLA